MSSAKKMLLSAAGVGGAGPDIAEVFSTFLYTGDGSNGTAIVNGIDLSGEGGLVWRKKRAGSGTIPDNTFVDTERGRTKFLVSNSTAAEVTSTNSITSFNNNGFTVVDNNSYGQNLSAETYASWTFRKAKKFFDVVTYTGDDTLGREIPHSLGTTIGSIFIKCTSTAGSEWHVYHKDCSDEDSTHCNSLNLNSNYGEIAWKAFGKHSTQTSAVFKLGSANNNKPDFNGNGRTYVAYLFAHNASGNGKFGPDADQDIIKCGGYTGNSGNTEIDLGFDPQWIMIKRTDSAEDWLILDVMRGWVNSGDDVSSSGQKDLLANTSAAEGTPSYAGVTPQPNGFKVRSGLDALYSSNGGTYIYMAIRAPMITPPAAATEVFAMDTFGSSGSSALPTFTSGFPVDMAYFTATSVDANYNTSRLTQGRVLLFDSKGAEGNLTAAKFDYNNGYYSSTGVDTTYPSWMWKRAKGYFDVVAYTGTGSAGTVAHGLGAVPEMMWVKGRDLDSQDWAVYHSATGTSKYLKLNETNAALGVGRITGTSNTTFTLDSDDIVNKSGDPYIAYLFATLAGISKVGSVSHSGSSTDVNCGFSNGARFVMLKRTDAAGDWYIWDSVRGIVAGNDPYLVLNTTAAEVTNTDLIDPLSSGFQISGDFTDGDYIFYAIA